MAVESILLCREVADHAYADRVLTSDDMTQTFQVVPNEQSIRTRALPASDYSSLPAARRVSSCRSFLWPCADPDRRSVEFGLAVAPVAKTLILR